MDFNIVVAAYDWKFTRSLVHQKFYSQPAGIFWNVQQNKNLWTCFDTVWAQWMARQPRESHLNADVSQTSVSNPFKMYKMPRRTF